MLPFEFAAVLKLIVPPDSVPPTVKLILLVKLKVLLFPECELSSVTAPVLLR